MRGRACQEAGTRGAKAGSQERESSLGSVTAGERALRREREEAGEGGRARPL